MNATTLEKTNQGTAYHINRLNVALKMAATDEVLLSYLGFLIKNIPIDSIQYLHVLKADWQSTLSEEVISDLLGNYSLKEELAHQIQALAESYILPSEDRKVEYMIKEGNPLEELIFRASLNEADLVLIGQDSEQVHHNILARNFLRKVKSDALVLPDLVKTQLGHILVPIDFSIHSLKALKRAVSINKSLKSKARIICINVYELPNLAFYDVEKTQQELKKIIEKDRHLAINHFLQKQVPDIKDRKYIRSVIVQKEAFDIGAQIHDFANENAIDMIIMGGKGHSKMDFLMMGSVTERVLSLNRDKAILIVKDV
jgi:nucleotide-binding universal stress UspA family protein